MLVFVEAAHRARLGSRNVFEAESEREESRAEPGQLELGLKVVK